MTDSKGGLFRSEALDYYSARREQLHGQLLRLSPDWTRWTYWLLVAAAVVGLVFVILVELPEYARGPAVIWMEHTIVTSKTAGTVVSVEVGPHQDVQANEPLLYLDSGQQEASRARLEREYDAQLVQYLSNPGDPGARPNLRALAAARMLAKAQLDERCVRAPQAGTIIDIRARPGLHCEPGDLLATLTGPRESSGCTVVAILPAQFRPFLHEGKELRLELSGYPYQYHTAKIVMVDQEALGPEGVLRVLGPEVGGLLLPQGPSVMVWARLADILISSHGQSYRVSHGMQGEAAVVVRPRRMLDLLFPWWTLVETKVGA